jgi:hypothetical protein
MAACPIADPSPLSDWEYALGEDTLPDEKHCTSASIMSMKMWRRMIVIVHVE